MKAAIDAGDRDFLERLHRLGSVTIHEICAHLGVTATAVRQRLGRLQDRNLVSREVVRANRGRPHHAYQLTGEGRRELGENYSDLVRILWTELSRIPEIEVRKRVLEGVRQGLAQHYGAGVRGDTLSERMKQLCESLVERGFDVELVDSSNSSTDPSEATHTEGLKSAPVTRAGGRFRLPVLRENNCPYLDLASSDPSICELEQEVFRQILGTTVTLTQCCLSGSHCCEFQAEEPLSEDAAPQRQMTATAVTASN